MEMMMQENSEVWVDWVEYNSSYPQTYLLCLFVGDKEKKFYNTDTWWMKLMSAMSSDSSWAAAMLRLPFNISEDVKIYYH